MSSFNPCLAKRPAFSDAPATDGNRDHILCTRIDRDNGKKHDAQYSDL
jgi:hypothetical protein